MVANSRNITLAETWRPGDQLKLIDGDIGSPDVAKQVMNSAIHDFGRIDLLVNKAGVFIPAITEYTIEDFRKARESFRGGTQTVRIVPDFCTKNRCNAGENSRS